MSEPTPIGVLIRLAADGELSPAQDAELRAHLNEHPEDETRIEYERELRRATSRVMGGVSLPDGLRERVLTAARDSADDGGPEHLAAQTRRQSFWQRPSRLVTAAAASILLIVAVWSAIQNVAGSPYITQVAGFVQREHDRCVVTNGQTSVTRKFSCKNREELDPLCEKILGKAPTLGELVSSGMVTFRDAGECHVPGKGTSVHLRFIPSNPAIASSISLFVQQAVGQLPQVEPGRTYLLLQPEDGKPSTIVWRAEDLLFYLVASQEACPLVLEPLHMPAPSQTIESPED